MGISIVAVDNEQQLIYFGRKDTPIERHLYRVGFDGGEITKVSSAAVSTRFHSAQMPASTLIAIATSISHHKSVFTRPMVNTLIGCMRMQLIQNIH